MKLQFAVTEKLREAKFVDPQLVLNAGILDLTKVKVDEKGAITEGLDDQLQALAKDRPYLINAEGDQNGTGTGKDGGVDIGSVTTREEFMKLSTDQQIAFKASNPELFKGFMAQTF